MLPLLGEEKESVTFGGKQMRERENSNNKFE